MSEDKKNEWVEIIEPTSREKMFANPLSGEILFTPPEGAIVKPMSDNQWWELFDQSTSRNYYYNAITGETIWNKPGNDADIISLTKLQSTSDSDHTGSVSPTQASESPVPVLEPVIEETDGYRQDEVFVDGNNSSYQPEVMPHPEPKRKLSELLEQEVKPLSPLQFNFPDPTFNFSKDLSATEEANTRTDGLTSVPDVEFRKSTKLYGDESGIQYQAHERDSWVNIKVVKNTSRHSSGSTDRERRDLDERTILGGSLDRTDRGRDQLGLGGYTEKAYTLEHRGSKKRQHVPVRPAPAAPPNKSPDSKLRSPVNLTPVFHTSAAIATATNNEALSRTKSDAAVPPAAPPFKPPPPHNARTLPGKAINSGVALTEFKELEQHRTGFIFKKKVTIANMLSWTKEPIKKPMIQTRDKQQRKEAVELFKLLLQYMGDRKTKYKDTNLLALEIAIRAWEKKGLRDEIYIQLCRQTSANDKPKSLEKGWEMIAICLAFFPPSIRFRSYLEGYLWRHVEPKPEYKGIHVEVFAQYCHKKVEKMAQSGAKKGLKKPNIEEVVHAKRAPFHPSMFGTSLEEVMELQKDKFPSYRMPWVVQALVDAVVQLQGPSTEGIFRVPGDIDEVNGLKLQMDKGLLPMDTLRDPHVPASLLKLWFRELEEPLIPAEYYQECIDNCDDEVNALSLIHSLPDLNRELLFYLVRFLKQFVTPENIERTKMGLENIAMVWAPNFLRCPSDDHALIFQNTRKEMAFLRLLLQFLDTESNDH